jgi:hypothetical protein
MSSRAMMLVLCGDIFRPSKLQGLKDQLTSWETLWVSSLDCGYLTRHWRRTR